MTAPWHSAAVTDVAFHSTHRKGYQSKLLFFHSKGGRSSSCGLLHCDDRRSPWWANRDGSQCDRSRSDIGMISMNFNSYASLLIFFTILALFCFVFDHETLLGIRIFRALQTFRGLHISMNARWRMNQLLNNNWANFLSLLNSQRGEWWVYVCMRISDCWAFRLFWTVPGFRAFSYSEKNWTHVNLLSWVQSSKDTITKLSFTSLTVHAYQTPNLEALSRLVNGAFSLCDQNRFAIVKVGKLFLM